MEGWNRFNQNCHVLIFLIHLSVLLQFRIPEEEDRHPVVNNFPMRLRIPTIKAGFLIFFYSFILFADSDFLVLFLNYVCFFIKIYVIYIPEFLSFGLALVSSRVMERLCDTCSRFDFRTLSLFPSSSSSPSSTRLENFANI